MESKPHKLFLALLLVCVLVACSSETIQTMEVTRSVLQTVEVTRIVPQTVIATQIIPIIATTTPEPLTPAVQTSQPSTDTLLIDGGIVIVQYYTLLDQGLFEEAYQLLSSSAQSPQSVEDFVAGAKMAFKTVNVITVQPYNEWASRRGYPPSEDPDGQKRFYVEIVAEGESGMSGSVPNGVVQHLWLGVVQENSEWKIDSFSTAPNP